jgi:hypothetical protein
VTEFEPNVTWPEFKQYLERKGIRNSAWDDSGNYCHLGSSEFVRYAEDTADEKVIVQESGIGQRAVGPFIAHSNWEVRSEHKEGDLAISVKRKDGELATVIHHKGPGRGFVRQAEGGTFILEVNGTGSWTVRIVQLPGF